MNKNQKYLFIGIVLAGTILLASCGSAAPQTPTIDPNAIITQVAQTVEAGLSMTQAAIPSATPTNTPQPTPTNTATPLVTNTPFTINTPTYQALLPGSKTSGDQLKFIQDITIPDGTIFKSGDVNDKTWEIQNIGTTTWNKNYRFYYCAGLPVDLVNKVLPKLYVNLDGDIAPSAKTQISVSIIAPDIEGHYKIYFQLLNASGIKVPDDAGNGCSLWVDFTVKNP
jgi:hypothetical protein